MTVYESESITVDVVGDGPGELKAAALAHAYEFWNVAGESYYEVMSYTATPLKASLEGMWLATITVRKHRS